LFNRLLQALELTLAGARQGLDTLPETMKRQLRLHLHRGISYLATPNKIRSISDLILLGRE
jgi:DNA sulfur modification protein DndE